MTRTNSATWKCIVCGSETSENVICRGCSFAEMNKQKDEAGSITAQQIWFIETKLLSKLESQITYSIILEIVPEYDYDMENLSTNQGKALIAKLLDAVEGKEVVHEKAMD